MTDDFRIPLANHRPLFGVFLAAHAIPDAIDVMHTGVGCKPKAQRQISLHDRMREAQNKMVWSDVTDAHLIAGSETQLVDMTVETVRRRGNVGIVFITTSTAMEMTGIDVGSLVGRIRQRAGCPVVYVATPGFEGDRHEGYARAVRAVMELMDWEGSRGDARKVNLVGYLFDRYEHDHAMNLREIGRMLASIGLELGVTFLSGVAMKELRAAPAAGASLLMPWARSLEGWVEEATLRPCGTAVLPLGPRFSERFLLAAAACASVSERTVRSAADRERERIEPLLRVARERVRGARVAVLADTPTAAGLASFLAELDMQVVLLGLLDRTLGGVAAMREVLRESRVETDPGCAVLEDPSAVDVEAAWRPADVLIAPDVWLPEAVSSTVRRVEIGFPSNSRHAIYGAPLLGFRGSVALAQRLLDAVCGVH